MKKLLIRLSTIPLIFVLGLWFIFDCFYWICTGGCIVSIWPEKWLNAVEEEI